MANENSRRIADWSVWLRFILTVGVVIAGISIAWGAVKTDVTMNSWRLQVAEKQIDMARQQIEEMRRTNEIVKGDVREVVTILKRMEQNGKTP